MRNTARIGAALLAGMALATCGGPTTSPSATTGLSAVDRALVLQQVVTAAASAFAGGSVGQRDASLPLGGLTCDQSCAGGSCTVTCPIDERIACPSGGTATDVGRITGVLDASLDGDATLEAAQGYSGCKPSSSLTLDGAPGTTATGTVRFASGTLADPQSVRVAGSVRYTSGDGSGTCSVDVTVTFGRSLHGSVSGAACGEPVSQPF